MIARNDIVRCNKCGNELDQFDIAGDYSIHKRMCYGSVHDGDALGLQLCSKCMDELIASCVIPPITELL